MAEKGQKKNNIPPKKRSDRADRAQVEHSGWRVLQTLVEGVLDLFNSNRIYPAFGLLFVLLAGLVVWRLPEQALGEVVKMLVSDWLVGKGGLVAMLVVTNIGWAFLYSRMRRQHQSEIDRLAEIRKELMHGPTVKTIAKHRSSDDDNGGSFFVPGSPQDDGPTET